MKFNLILAYRNLINYIAKGTGEDAWTETMVEPYWGILTKDAPFPMDHLKPMCSMDREQAKSQLELLDEIDWDKYDKLFEEISLKLPKEEEDVIHIVIYPSMTEMSEGIYGTGVWGNIILNINPLNENAIRWIPFVFAHEYHHSVWGDYWFCKQGGEGLDSSFLQNLIIEGEADAFARSLNPGFIPSWHQGVSQKEELVVWNKMEQILDQSLNPEEYAKYMFGSKELGIPENAGYYYAIRIVDSFLKNSEPMSFTELMKLTPKMIYQKAQL